MAEGNYVLPDGAQAGASLKRATVYIVAADSDLNQRPGVRAMLNTLRDRNCSLDDVVLVGEENRFHRIPVQGLLASDGTRNDGGEIQSAHELPTVSLPGEKDDADDEVRILCTQALASGIAQEHGPTCDEQTCSTAKQPETGGSGGEQRESHINCAIYARTLRLRSGNEAIEPQIEICLTGSKEQGLGVQDDHIFTDCRDSHVPFGERTGMKRLIEAAQSTPRPFDVVLIDKNCRFSRKSHEIVRVYSTLSKAGVKVRVVAPNRPSHND